MHVEARRVVGHVEGTGGTGRDWTGREHKNGSIPSPRASQKLSINAFGVKLNFKKATFRT